MSAFLAFLHHFAAFTVVAAIATEFVLLRGEIDARSARTLRIVDAVYGASAGALLLVGALRVFYFEKGSAYYFNSVPFYAKMGLFLAVGLLSIYPTLTFRSPAPGSLGARRDRRHPALRRADGARHRVHLVA